MIYVSSSCFKNGLISASIKDSVCSGFFNIELSGGTIFYPRIEFDLLEHKKRFNLNFLCHNYFPPPERPFVLNLASLDDFIYNESLQHLKKSIVLSKKLGARKFGLHAGFFIDITVNDIGRGIACDHLFDKDLAMQRFCEGFKELQKFAGDLALYVENNVFSFTNGENFQGVNPFMLCSYEDYLELQRYLDFNLLLDIGHLKVSAKTLQLDFVKELGNMLDKSDYIHVSDNDGLHDLNMPLTETSELTNLLSNFYLKNKDYTLEIYDNKDRISESYEILERLCK